MLFSIITMTLSKSIVILIVMFNVIKPIVVMVNVVVSSYFITTVVYECKMFVNVSTGLLLQEAAAYTGTRPHVRARIHIKYVRASIIIKSELVSWLTIHVSNYKLPVNLTSLSIRLFSYLHDLSLMFLWKSIFSIFTTFYDSNTKAFDSHTASQ